MKCTEKHSAYQPSEDEWLCPLCGSSELWVYEGFCGNEECQNTYEIVHETDVINCDGCSKQYTGKEIAELMYNKRHSDICPTCNGMGWVKHDQQQ